MYGKKGKHANNLTRINDQVKLLIVMLWISHWTHKANIGESERRPKTKSVVLLAYLVFEFFGSCMNQASWSMSVRVLEKESKEVSFGLRMNSLFLQFVTLRWGWQCASFPFLHSLLQPTLSFALAGMILIDFQRERERERNSKGKVNCGFLRQLLKYPHSLLKGKMPSSNSFLLLGGGKYQDHYIIMFSSWSLWLRASEIC